MEACAALKEPGGHPVISEPADIVKGVRVKVHLTHYCSPTSLFLRCELSAIVDADGQDEFHISPRNNHVEDAFIGMSCLVCQDSIGTLSLRALVTDVHRDTSGAALNVEVLYVDSGRTDFVGLDSVYTIDAEAAAEPQRAIACCLRRVEPTAASSSFDLKQLLKRGAAFEAIFYTASDAGVYNVDLYAVCRDQESGLKTYDVGRYLVQNGFAKFMDCLADTMEAVASAAESGVSVSPNSGEDTPQNSMLQRPSSLLPTSSEPTGDIPPLRGAESSAVHKEDSLEILVTFVSSPDHFYGQNVNKVEEWSLVQNLILQSTKKLFLETEIKTGATYIYRELPEQSGNRVRVEDVQESGMCRIFLLDYGNRKTVHFSSLFMAHPRLSCIPPLAMRFQLSDIKPQTAWTEAAVNRFVELAHTGTPLTAVLAGTKRSHDQFNDTVHTVKLFSPTHGDVAECMTQEGHANRTALEPVQNLARPCDAVREDHNGPLFSDNINAEDASVGAFNVGTKTGRRICRFYATQGSCTQQDRCTYSHGLRTTAPLSKPVIDPVKQLRPPEAGSYVLGQVSAVVSPSCFFLVFPYGRRSVERLSMEGRGEYSGRTLEALIRRLQAACKKRSFRENKRIVKAQGELVAAKSNQDGRWYRARVVSLEEGDMLKVFYVDFGFCESVPVDQVRSLEVRFTHLPQQALQACLVTNKHENRLGDKPTWDAHSCEAFANCVSGKDLVVKIVSVAQGMLHVRLFFTDGEQLCSVWRCLRNAYRTDLN